MSVADFARRFELEGCFNFRDLGGYRTTDGCRTAWRRLFRSDGLQRLSETDLASLGELGLSTVVDLRSSDEAARLPGRHPPSALSYRNLPLLEVLPDVEAYRAWTDPAVVSEHYLEMLEQGASSIAAALEVLGDPGSYPVVFHCAVGKDRTGVLAAVVLGLLDVVDDDVVADFVESRQAVNLMIERVKAEASEPIHPGRLAALDAVEADTMVGFLTGVRDIYGSFSGYAQRIGVAAAVPRLRELLLG